MYHLRGLAPFLICVVVHLLSIRAIAAEQRPIHAYPAPQIDLQAALAKEDRSPGRSLPVTGVGGPHHIIAADLIARAMLATRGNRYDRIVILSPDHFFKATRPAATTTRRFETAFGHVETDAAAVGRLLEGPAVFSESDLFEREHGILTWLPFIRVVQPDTPVVAVALRIDASWSDWDSVVEALETIVTPRTLIVQSTDFSHYLPPAKARARDQETLNVFSTNNAHEFGRLIQPDHLDSTAAAYVQMRLQNKIFGARPAVIANRTANDYVQESGGTTSYIVTAYGPDPAALSRLRYDDQTVHFFGGDVFVGRNLKRLVADPNIRDRMIAEVLRVTEGAPLVVNLEGAVADEEPVAIPARRHVMLASLTDPILKGLNVVAASQANNHSHDLGSSGARETTRRLRGIGIRPLRHLEPVDLGPLRIVAVNYVGAGDYKRYPAARPPSRSAPSDIERLCRTPIKPPTLAFVHWGEEYADTATPREKDIADDLARCGIVAVIGAHSHRASSSSFLAAAGEQTAVYSVGNLLFDQLSTTSTGALVEVRTFRGGTLAMRVVPIPNLYELGLPLRGRPSR